MNDTTQQEMIRKLDRLIELLEGREKPVSLLDFLSLSELVKFKMGADVTKGMIVRLDPNSGLLVDDSSINHLSNPSGIPS